MSKRVTKAQLETTISGLRATELRLAINNEDLREKNTALHNKLGDAERRVRWLEELVMKQADTMLAGAKEGRHPRS